MESEMTKIATNLTQNEFSIAQFDALMEEAQALSVISQFGSDEELEVRISRESGSAATSSC